MLDSFTTILGSVLLGILLILVVVALGSLVIRLFKPKRHQAVIPGPAFGKVDMANVTRQRPEQWDFFISYKSEDANVVRRVAERLIAGGFRVWFAEYEVLLRNFDEFLDAIQKGTQNCTFGLLFTTSRYATSKYCQQEVNWLRQSLDHMPGHIIEVSLEETNDAWKVCNIPLSPPRLVYELPALIADDHGQEARLFDALATRTGLDLNRCKPVQLDVAKTTQFCARCTQIGFDTTGFYLDAWQRHSEDGSDVVRFVSMDTKVPLEFNVCFDFSLQYAPGKPYSIATAPVVDDRKLYDERRQFSSWWMRKMGQLGASLEEEGLHLVWRDNRTHVALTHRFDDYWMRKYSLILDDRALSRPTEVIFTFGLKGDFGSFCSLAPLMDRIVESVHVTDPRARTTTVQHVWWRKLLSLGPKDRRDRVFTRSLCASAPIRPAAYSLSVSHALRSL